MQPQPNNICSKISERGTLEKEKTRRVFPTKDYFPMDRDTREAVAQVEIKLRRTEIRLLEFFFALLFLPFLSPPFLCLSLSLIFAISPGNIVISWSGSSWTNKKYCGRIVKNTYALVRDCETTRMFSQGLSTQIYPLLNVL